MIEVRNLKIHNDIPFDEYLKIPGYSFSGVCAENRLKPFEVTKKMRFGSQVDSYLFTPSEFKLDHEFSIQQIRSCALCIKQKLGAIYKHLEFQISITADFVYEGFVLHYKGRPDSGIRNILVVDLKLTEGMNPRYNYPAQLSGYAIALGAPIAFIAAQHPKKEICDIHQIEVTHDFWQQQILLKGEQI